MKNKYFQQYKEIIKKTLNQSEYPLEEIDRIAQDLRNHINQLDQRIIDRRNDLLIALRFVETFRILDWIKICILCGAYQTVFKELRFLLDSVMQAYYIDYNHHEASLKARFEVYKALENWGGFIGTKLFSKVKGIHFREELNLHYRELSNYVHPSTEESLTFIDANTPNFVDSLKKNTYNEDLIKKCIEEVHKTKNLLIQIDSHFEKSLLELLNN